MSKTAAAFNQAWQDYRRHLRPLVTASALLTGPTIAIALGRRLLAVHTDLPLSPLGSVILSLVAFAVQLVSVAAVALLAADLRAGGTWGWRESWSRALARLRPIVTGYLFGGILTCLAVAPLFMPIVWAVLGRDGAVGGSIALSNLIGLGAFGGYMFCASTVLGLLPLVTAIDRTGGFRAARVAWQVLKKDLRRSVLTVGLAEALVFVPNLAVMFGGVGDPWLLALKDAVAMLVSPFVVLVALSVYWEARDAGGAGAAQLRADLDAR